MKRKVNLVGQNTLTVSLPKKWVEKNNIKKGDEIDVEEERNALLLSAKKKITKRKVIIDVDQFNTLMLNRFLDELYVTGTEEIVLKYKKGGLYSHQSKMHEDIIAYSKKISERYIGMEIVSQKPGNITLQSLMSQEDFQKINVIQHRIVFLIKELLNEYISALDKDFSEFDKRVYDYHDNIVKFINYYLRLLYQSDNEEYVKDAYTKIYSLVAIMIDKVRHASKRTVKIKTFRKEFKQTLKEIFDFFIRQFDILTKNDLNTEELHEIICMRYNVIDTIRNKRKYSIEEYYVIGEINIFLDTINNFVECYAAINMERYVEKY